MRKFRIPFNVASAGWQKVCTEHGAAILANFVKKVAIAWRGRMLTEEQVLALWSEFKSQQP